MIGSGSKCPDKINYRNLTYRDSLSVARMFSAPTLMHYSFHYMKCYILLMHSTNVLMKKVLNIFLYNDIANQFFFSKKGFLDSFTKLQKNGGGKIFRTCPDRPWAQPSLL